MNLDVYDVTNTTLQGTLSEVYGVGFYDDLLALGYARFQVDAASSADLALLVPRRVVRFRTGGSAGTGDVFACVVQDRPSSLVADIEPESGGTISVVSFECPALMTWLGYQTGGAVLYPYGGLDGRQQNPRMFGPFAADFDDAAWSAPTLGGTLSTDGWPDDAAEAFEFTNQAIFRRTTTAVATSGPARMYMVADWRTAVDVYRNGDKVFSKPAGQTGLFYKDVEFDGLADTFVLHCVRNAAGTGRVGWAWLALTEGTDADGNDTFTLGSVLRRTFDPLDFPSADGDWLTLDNYTNLPGVNVGYVLDVGLQEASDRSHAPLPTWSFDGAGDTGSVAWTVEFARGFRLQELGLLLDELTSIEGEAEMTPAGVLGFYKRRGQDRSATVTVSSPFGLNLSGRGPQATRWLYETEGGLGQAVNASAETSLGVRMEQFVQLGTDISPEGIGTALVAQLVEDGKVLDEVEVDLPDAVVPYTDAFLGDTVTCDARSGTGTVRLTSFTYELSDANGAERWVASAVPYTEVP